MSCHFTRSQFPSFPLTEENSGQVQETFIGLTNNTVSQYSLVTRRSFVYLATLQPGIVLQVGTGKRKVFPAASPVQFQPRSVLTK